MPRSHVAAIGLDDGWLTGWHPEASDRVSALSVANGTVYVGGRFTHIGGELMPYFAPLEPSK